MPAFAILHHRSARFMCLERFFLSFLLAAAHFETLRFPFASQRASNMLSAVAVILCTMGTPFRADDGERRSLTDLLRDVVRQFD